MGVLNFLALNQSETFQKITDPKLNKTPLNLEVRQLTFKDLRSLEALEIKKWGQNGASLNLLNSRIANSPNFSWAVFDDKNEALASCFVMGSSHEKILNSKSWFESTDNGTAKTHDSEAKVWFGISLSGDHPPAVDLLLKEVCANLFRQGVQSVYLGAPIPGYSFWKEFNPKGSVEDYVHSFKIVRRKKIYRDPLINYYCQLGFKIVKVLPDYFPHEKSDDFGVLIRLDNPLAKLAPILRQLNKSTLHWILNRYKAA